MRTAKLAVLAVAAILFAAGCDRNPSAPSPAEVGEHHRHVETEEHHAEHKAFHDGCLNAVVSCENGHAEVRVEGSTLTLWFVNGGSDTGRAVGVPEAEILLTAESSDDAPARTVLLKAKPNELAEERIGDCSTFEGTADWLKDIEEFHATGPVTFKGKKEELRIDYPHGYDPD